MKRLIEQVLEGNSPIDVVDSVINEAKKEAKVKKMTKAERIAKKKKEIESSQIIMKGISDDVDYCQLCGKAPLKRTVALDIDGDIVYYGTTCASMVLGMDKKYPGSKAEKLVTDYKQKVIDDANQKVFEKEREDALKNAQKEADTKGKIIYLNRVSRFPSGWPGYFYTVEQKVFAHRPQDYKGYTVALLIPKGLSGIGTVKKSVLYRDKYNKSIRPPRELK